MVGVEENVELIKITPAGYRLGVRREAFGLTVTTLARERFADQTDQGIAEELEITAAMFSDWASGKGSIPKLPTVFRIAKKLEVRVEQLLTGVDDTYDAVRIDLPLHPSDLQRKPPQHVVGGSRDAVAARLLERERKARQALVSAVDNAADELFRIATDLEREAGAPKKTRPSRGARARKTG